MEDTLSTGLSPGGATRHPNIRLPATCEPPSETNPPKQAVWIIFGATGHMGNSLCRAALAHNDLVAAVGWTDENKMAQMQSYESETSFGTLCDVRVRMTVKRVIDQTVKRWGRVDVIANCTGYGIIGACEDQSEADLRSQFETNFLGTLHILQLSLPLFRAQSQGRYLIFSSTSGALGVPGLGPYCATKYAVEGLIESMLYEIDCFNIKATLVEPGHVRLDDEEGMGNTASTPGAQDSGAAKSPKDSSAPHLRRYGHFYVKENPSAAYDTSTAPAGHAKRLLQWLNDRQPTSAVKSAELVWQLGHCSYPPLRLLLGTYAVESIRDRLKSITEEIEDWKHLNFPTEEGMDDAKDGTQPLEHRGADELEGVDQETEAERMEDVVAT